MRAFHGDPAVKRTFLARIDQGAFSGEKGGLWSEEVQQDADGLAKFSDEFGLHSGFLMLVRGLQGALFPNIPSPIRQMLEAIPAGADTGALVRRWILSAWEGTSPPLRDWIGDAETRGPADVIAGMHRASLAGECHTRQAWRAARKALHASAPDPRGLEAMSIGTIAASSWDLDTTPGMAGDVVKAFCSASWFDLDRRIGWTSDHQRQHGELGQGATNAAYAAAGPQPANLNADTLAKWIATPDGKGWRERFEAGRKAYFEAHPSSLYAQFEERSRERITVRDAMFARLAALATKDLETDELETRSLSD